jgi:hypothetical protein
MRVSTIRLRWALCLLHRSARRRGLTHLPLRGRIVALVIRLRLLDHRLRAVRDSLARPGHIALWLLLRCRSLIDGL